nr:MAG TPA: hypothetical protein [Bacteriophage sp.]
MNFLDESGLKNLWAKIKASFGTAVVASSECQLNSEKQIDIPFIANHQIVTLDRSGGINVFNWLKDASEGGILEIVYKIGQGGNQLFCTTRGESIIYKVDGSQFPPGLKRINYLNVAYDNYARLIKLDGMLIVVEFVENK